MLGEVEGQAKATEVGKVAGRSVSSATADNIQVSNNMTILEDISATTELIIGSLFDSCLQMLTTGFSGFIMIGSVHYSTDESRHFGTRTTKTFF